MRVPDAAELTASGLHGQPAAVADEKPTMADEDKDQVDLAAIEPETGLPKQVSTSVAVLAFIVIALLSAVVALTIRKGKFQTSAPSVSQTEAQLRANDLRNQVNALRAAQNLPPIEENFHTESLEEIARRMKKDADLLVTTSTAYQKLLDEKIGALANRNEEYLESERIRDGLATEVSRLKKELQQAMVGGSEVTMLKRDFEAVKKELMSTRAELDAASEKIKELSENPDADDYAELKRRYDETVRAKEFFEARCKELEGDLTKAKLFASSENELLPAAVELFRSLRKLEGKRDSEISSAYSSLGAELGANVLKTLSFATGASKLNSADEEAIRKLVSDIPDGDLILAIGYASETGNVDGNRTLSSDRATAAAEFISSVKRPGQFTQAVYLGQTDRFSSHIPERNQIVEIWQIRKK